MEALVSADPPVEALLVEAEVSLEPLELVEAEVSLSRRS